MRSFIKKPSSILLFAVCAATGASADTILVGDGNLGTDDDITVSTTWTADNTYNLQEQIYVKNGATLTIEAGVVVASTATTNGGGALAVTRDSQIFIEGTESDPVLFTSMNDVATWDADGGHPTGGDPTTGFWREAANEWGNLTIMGQGYVSAGCSAIPNDPFCDAGNRAFMEGLLEDGSGRSLYGGGNDDHDSGSISYLSLRYGGRVLGLGNELNGLSLGGIGRGTDIDHVEIMNNVDDGIEIWGGCVGIKYFTIWNVGDDSLDVDQGWRGKAQFGLIVQGYSLDASQGSGVGDNCCETDGAEKSDWQPVTTATVYNLTVIGQPTDGDHGTTWRDNARIQYRDCIFMDIGGNLVNNDVRDNDCNFSPEGYGFNGTLPFLDTGSAPFDPNGNTIDDPDIWDTAYTVTSTVNACSDPGAIYKAQSSGMLAEISDSVFYNAGDTTLASAIGLLSGHDNVVATMPPIAGIDRASPVVKGGHVMEQVIFLDPRAANDATSSAGMAPDDGFFCPVGYRGAFADDENWALGWTAADAFCFLSFPATATARNGGANPMSFTSSPFIAGGTLTATVDNALAGELTSVLLLFDSPFNFTLGGGQTLLCIDLGGNGELFTGGGLGPSSSGGGLDFFTFPVPESVLAFCGASLCAQAIQFGTPPFTMSNAVDYVIGNN